MLVLSLLLVIAPGCNKECGTYEIRTGTDLISGDDTISMDRDDLYEPCGELYGSHGSWDLYEDGTAVIWFDPDAHDDVESMLIGMHTRWVAYFPLDELAVGQTATAVGGYAALIDGGTETLIATLTSGTMTVHEEIEADDGWGNRVWDVSWAVTWGDPAGDVPWYQTEGADELAL